MEHRFVTIARFRNSMESDFFQSLLQAQGFDAHTRGTASFNANPFFGTFERIRLQVPADQAKAAVEFLRQQPPPSEEQAEAEPAHDESAESDAIEEDAAERRCPNCDAVLTPPPHPRLRRRILMAFAAGFTLGFMQGGTDRLELACVAGSVAACCAGVYFASRRRRWRCLVCDWESEDAGAG